MSESDQEAGSAEIKESILVSESRVLNLRKTLKKEISRIRPAFLKKRLDESDIVQEVIVIACRSLHRFRGSTEVEFTNWLRKMVRARVKELVKFNIRKRRDVRREIESGQVEQLPAVKSGYDSSSLLKKESLLIKKALIALSQRDRDVIQMKLQEGLSFVEIGRRINCTPDNARKIWARSLNELGKMMEQYENNDQ